MWIKICGIARPEDAALCAAEGVDAIGLNFYQGPRKIDILNAGPIVEKAAESTSVVALVGVRDGRVEGRLLIQLRDLGIHRLQIYGPATPALLQDLDRMSFEAIIPSPVEGAEFAKKITPVLESASPSRPWAVLLDACSADRPGGTGKTFRWSWVSEARDAGLLETWPNVILAGGLTDENVLDAVAAAMPFGVDVCSGVESAPGIKSPERVRAFVDAVRRAPEHA